ncbi:MAG: hypothetical protein HZB30_07855 [Nitrospirae bacterium]|nr:hypothetical protein [Nitrospirota bacterium]
MAISVKENISNRVYFTIFSVSCSVLMFEVSLTRLFSIYLWYHFAFMVISIAMLGIGAAGAMLALFPNRFCSASNIGAYAMFAGVSLLLCYIVSNHIPFDPVKFSWNRLQILYLALYCLILSIPFFFSGLLIAIAFLLYSEKSNLIYGSDLLGAGTGSLVVLILLNITAPEYTVAAASLLCFTGALATCKNKFRALSLLILIINLIVIVIHPDFMKVRMSPYKRLPLYLNFPGAEHLKTLYSSYSQIDLFKSPAVRYAPGLSLNYPDPLPEQIGLAIDGDRIDVITDAHDKSGLRFLEFLPSAAVYQTGKINNVLILDPKGGLHVLMAEYYGAKKIHKVESNPMVIKTVRDNYNEFSGKIYQNNTWTGYGRSFLRTREKGSYDLIDLSMTGASVSAVFGISEDYRLTVDAFKQYLNALKQDGIISVSLYLIPPPRIEFKILATIATAFEQTGIKDPVSRLFAIRSWDSMTVLIKNSPFTGEEIERLKDFSRNKHFDLVYYPGIKKEEANLFVKLSSDEYFNGFKNIITPETRSLYINNYLFDIEPVYDTNPFFHYYLRLKNIKAIYEIMGHKFLYFLEEGYLLPVIFMIVFVLSTIITIVPVLFRSISYGRFKKFEQLKPVLLYFGMLGLGFMFVEITMIQKTILLLENPLYSVATVVTAILVSSGIGGISSSKLSRLSSPFSLLILSSLIVVYSFMQPVLSALLLSLDLIPRMIIWFIMLLPLGFFMGIPFPTGMKILGEKSQTLIPWAWAINGCLSVLAPILTIMIALATGFQVILGLSALTYLLAFFSLKSLRK